MIKISDRAVATLMSARPQTIGNSKEFYMIKRTLGYITWASGGETGARADITELYRNGLIREWFNPWVPPVYLTPEGLAEYHARVGK